MLSPMMTVFVLAVLWLIVVVPMLFRRHDERRREKSVDGFGRSMRALGRRAPAADARAEVFVPSARRAEEKAVSTRRPVPAAQEALMYPVDRSEMSEARAQMMARRRRSLGILGAGTMVLVPTAFLTGGLMWLVAAAVHARPVRLPAVPALAGPARPRPPLQPPAARGRAAHAQRGHDGRRRHARAGRRTRRHRPSRSCASTTTTSSCTTSTPSTSPGSTTTSSPRRLRSAARRRTC